MNKIILQGRLTRDPEIKLIGDTTTVTNFSLAVNRKFKNKDTGEYDADFFNCQVWNKPGEVIANYVKKGHQILVSGRVQNRSYEAEDGTTKYVTEVIVEDFDLLNNRDIAESPTSKKDEFKIEVEEDEELEFNI